MVIVPDPFFGITTVYHNIVFDVCNILYFRDSDKIQIPRSVLQRISIP